MKKINNQIDELEKIIQSRNENYKYKKFDYCQSQYHYAPSYISVGKDTIYVHKCPDCGNEIIIDGNIKYK